MMDNCYAPQWADFACSPQLSSDSYFEVEHEVHNSRIDFKSELPLPCKKENIEESLVAETNFEDSLESAEGTHANVVFFVPHDGKKQKETNDNDIKKDKKLLKSNLYYTWDISMTDLKSTSVTTSVPQRLKAAAWKEIRKNTCIRDTKNNIIHKPQQKVQRRQSDLSKTKQPQRKVLTCQYGRRSLMKYRRRSSKFVSMAEAISKFQNETPERFRTTSNKDSKLGPLVKLKRSPLKLTHPVSPTLRCKQRVRHTNVLSQEEREALEVEQMKKYQIKANPVPINIFKGPPVLKKVPKKLITVTEEFKLTNSKKTRHTIAPGLPKHHDNEQNHKNTVSTMSSSPSVSAVRKNDKVQTHKNVIAVSRSISASAVRKDSKEQNKNVKPMSRSISASAVRKDSKEPNKNVKPMSRSISASAVRKDSKEHNDKNVNNPTSCSTSASTIRTYDKEHTFKNAKSMSHSFSASNITKKQDKGETRKNAVPISRSLSASNVRKTVKEQISKNAALTDRSINASDIVANIAAKPVLNVLPSSFEARNKDFQQKKTEKLKHLQMQETNKLKAEFHAKPLPKFSKPTNSAKEPVTKKRTVISCPFSFAERDKHLAKKKEELVKKMQKNEKKVPVFHANPVPTFKPVVIHGVAKEKNSNKNITTKQLKNFPDQENKQPNIIIGTSETKGKDSTRKKPFKSTNNVNDDDEKLKANQKKTAFEMNTDKRAKERSEFDEKLNKREQEMEAKRQQEEKQRMLKEKSERAELRKLADVKATPVPVYKPIIILKSTKMPTSPKDPKWASKNRLKNTLQV